MRLPGQLTDHGDDSDRRTGLRRCSGRTGSCSDGPDRPHVARAQLLPRPLEARQEASGLGIRPHECRHSYVTHLRAAGVNDADLAEIAGHRVETMLARYTHAVGTSFEAIGVAID